MGGGWGDPPQESIEDNGEGQEDHGGSTASLGNVCEGLYGDLVQDRPLWMIPANKNPISWRPGQAASSLGREPWHFQNC